MRRPLYLGVTLALLVVTGLIAHASGITFATANSISFGSGSSINYSAPHGTIFGYSTHPPSSDPSLSTYYTELLNAGAIWQRTDLRWASVQATSSGSYVWGPYDNMANEAAADGIQTIFIIDATPNWAVYFNCTPFAGSCAPVNAATLATFCAAAATRYNGKITYWEIWNEQNGADNWGPSATSSDYVTDLNACGAAIKNIEPNATIITGGLNYSGDISVTQSVSDYITDGAQFDMLALHPYTFNVDINDPTFGWGAKVNPVRAQLNAAGLSSKKIAITEYGAPTCGSNPNSTFASQAEQARALIASSTSSNFTYLNIFQPIFWYTLVDANSNDGSTSENCFGVYYTNGQPKPAFMPLRSN